MAQDICPLQKREMRSRFSPQLGQTSICICRLYQPEKLVDMPSAHEIPCFFNSHRKKSPTNPPATTPVRHIPGLNSGKHHLLKCNSHQQEARVGFAGPEANPAIRSLGCPIIDILYPFSTHPTWFPVPPCHCVLGSNVGGDCQLQQKTQLLSEVYGGHLLTDLPFSHCVPSLKSPLPYEPFLSS